MVDVFMALLSFVDSTPRAYRLKASNAAPLISTLAGTFPQGMIFDAVICMSTPFTRLLSACSANVIGGLSFRVPAGAVPQFP
jgi:hypothetical protein